LHPGQNLKKDTTPRNRQLLYDIKRQNRELAKMECKRAAEGEVLSRRRVRRRHEKRERRAESVAQEEAATIPEPHNPPFRFGDLPPEIIDMIYKYTLIKRFGNKPALLCALRFTPDLYSAALRVYY
jgi:hypothetical protein